jgi:hypothetical protein
MSEETPRGTEGAGERDQLIGLCLRFVGVPNGGAEDPYYQLAAKEVDQHLESRPAAAPATPFRCTEDEGGLIVEDAAGKLVFTASHGSNALDIWDTRPEAMQGALLAIGDAFLRGIPKVAPTFDDVAHQVLISFLERVGSGETSGSFAEWPQLRPACRYAAQRLRAVAAPEALDLADWLEQAERTGHRANMSHPALVAWAQAGYPENFPAWVCGEVARRLRGGGA